MENKKSTKYYLGLDIGTNSVGWCVTNEEYKIIKKHRYIKDLQSGKIEKRGQLLWGARLFLQAKSAAERRQYRTNRRRLARRKWRLKILRDLFADEMNKVDQAFFIRLDNSAFHFEDKDERAKTKYLLFNDNKMTDHTFYKRYPTIYHLRYALMNDDFKHDIREIYLAMAHMIKYRGNFLSTMTFSESKDDNSSTDDIIKSKFDEIDELINNLNIENREFGIDEINTFNCDSEMANKLRECFQKTASKSELIDYEKEIFEELKGFKLDIFKLINGSKITNIKNFDITGKLKETNPDFLKNSIDFNSDNFEVEILPLLQTELSTEIFEIIKIAKDLFDNRVLIRLLKNENSISSAMVKVYVRHGEQLKELKALFTKYCPDKKEKFFTNLKDESSANYANYANYAGWDGKRIAEADLCKEIKKIFDLDNIDKENWALKEKCTGEDKEKFKAILASIDSLEYLNRQNSRSNGVLPYQLNEVEMRKIIEKQSKYYPFLANKAKSFLDPNHEEYMLISLLEFKIPYYVGPLSNKTDSDRKDVDYRHWAIKKQENIKIYPWNFDDVIDKNESATRFIERMTNHCSYIFCEETLPKCSLIYQKYVLLNEINKWLVNGEPIKKEDKDYLIENVYLKQKKPGTKAIQNAFNQKYCSQEVILSTSTGKEIKTEDMHANLSSWIAMSDEKGFGAELFKNKELQELAETIIKDITLLEDKKILWKELEKLNLTDAQRKYFISLTFKDWGRVSKKLLVGLKTEILNNETGELCNHSIMDLLEETNKNFMEIYESDKQKNSADRYTFKEQVDEINNANKEDLEDILDKQYLNNQMKKAVRQTLKIVNELKKFLNIQQFDGYFVECTRQEGKKVRTKSRFNNINEMFDNAIKKLKEEHDNDALLTIEKVQTKLNDNFKSAPDKLDSKKLYLYFLQLGRSVYSGKEIDLDNLQNYDIDHIIPQAKLKDDSFDNIVLVERSLNNSKQDEYPIPSSILSEDGKKWIETLNGIDDKLMPTSKMKKIFRKEPLTEDELTGFVNRQLTTTNQSVKAVCEILKQTEKVGSKEPRIVYSKACLVHEFRQTFKLYKCRELNDYHHSHDAYLNIVVGNTYDKRFKDIFTKEDLRIRDQNFESTKIDVPHFFRSDICIGVFNNTPIWKKSGYYNKEKRIWIENENDDGTINTVKKYIFNNKPLITQALYTQPGLFDGQTIYPSKSKDSKIPLKESEPFSSTDWQSKYGGYNAYTYSYFVLVESKKKNKFNYSLEAIPKIIDIRAKGDFKSEVVCNYLRDEIGLKQPIIICKCLIHTIIDLKDNDTYVRTYLKAKGDNRINLVSGEELVISKEYLSICYALIEAYQKKKFKKENLTDDNLNRLFDYFVNNIFSNNRYKKVPGLETPLINIENEKSAFYKLDLDKKIICLFNIINIFACKSRDIDLSVIGLAKKAAKIRRSKILSSGTRISLSSYTGLYETIVFTIPEK